MKRFQLYMQLSVCEMLIKIMQIYSLFACVGAPLQQGY